MRKKVLNFMVVIAGCLFYQLSYAQVFTNNGAMVHVQNGALVFVNGDVLNRDNGMNQGVIRNYGNFWCANGTGYWGDFTNTNGAETHLENGSRLYVARNYTNDAEFYGKLGSNVYFNGTTNQIFTRTANANLNDDFYRVYIQNTATGNNGVRLASGSTISNMVVSNQLQFDSGIIITDLPAADAYPYVPGAAGSGNYVEVRGTITGTDPNVTYSDKYVAGILRRQLPMATGIVNFPVGGLRANPAMEKEMNQIGLDFTSVPDYGQYLTVYFRTLHTGMPVNVAECGNDGYDAWIGNGRWIVIPDDNTGTAGYHVRTHPRNYDAIYTTYDYTQYTGNASATVQKATTGNTDWNVYGTCNPASTLNPMATALVIRNGQSGFSEFAVSVDDDKPFPVEMLPLVAVPDNTNQLIKLYWNTLSEVNNAGFEIQRSLDGSSFNKIHPGAWVNGQGNSNSQVNYTYDDRMVEPNVKYYYRLKQIDFNGAYKYSNIAEAILSPNFQFGVVFYPNPTQDIMNLTLTSDKDQSLNLIVYNAIGQQIFNETYNVKPGASNIQLDAFRNITKGVYTAVISNGSETITHKLVKIQ